MTQQLEIDDTFYWRKRSGPVANKDVDKHSRVEWCANQVKTIGLLVKTYHVPQIDGCWGRKKQEWMDRNEIGKDLIPYVHYSLNKHRRWELEPNVDMLSELKNIHPDTDVFVIDRFSRLGQYSFHPFEAPFFSIKSMGIYNMFQGNHIVNIQYLDENGEMVVRSRPRYGEQFSKIMGLDHKLSQKKPLNYSDNTLIAYNFLRPTENRIILNKIHCDTFIEYYMKHTRRLQLNLDRTMDMRYDPIETEYDIHEYEEEDEEDEEGVGDGEEDRRRPGEFYNLQDHFVDKFVIVKNKKK